MRQQGRHQFRRLDLACKMQRRHCLIAVGLEQLALTEQRQSGDLVERGEHLYVALSACPLQKNGSITWLVCNTAYCRLKQGVLRILFFPEMPGIVRLWQVIILAIGAATMDVGGPAVSRRA